MPAKNSVRYFDTTSYYHVFNRGVAKQNIFLDQADKRYFLTLLERYLDPDCKSLDAHGAPYPKFTDRIELLSYCLMANHYHMLLYVDEDRQVVSELMRSVSTAYTMYFNLKYQRVGPLFQGRFKATKISSDGYLLHITRYIHMNPRHYHTYKYSSLPVYLGQACPVWLRPERIMSLFSSYNAADYSAFLHDYETAQAILQGLKHELANY